VVPRSSRLASPLALAIAALLVVFLAFQNRTLREELRTLRRRAERPYPGLVVPTFRAVTLVGDSVMIGEGVPGVRQVLFIFNTTCGFCRGTLPYWSSIADELVTEERREVEVYGMSVDSQAETRLRWGRASLVSGGLLSGGEAGAPVSCGGCAAACYW